MYPTIQKISDLVQVNLKIRNLQKDGIYLNFFFLIFYHYIITSNVAQVH